MKIAKITGTMGMLASLCLWLGASTSAHATLYYNSPDLVGTAKALTGDGQGNPVLELQVAQSILNVNAGLASGDSSGRLYLNNNGVANNGATGGTPYNYSAQYGGTITTVANNALVSAGGATSVAAGWDYVVAKYDGPNGGYIVFYLGGLAATLPTDSYTIWGANDGQYGISGFTAFDVSPPTTGNGNGDGVPAVPEPSTIVAGGLVLIPLITSFVRVGSRRKNSLGSVLEN